MPKTYPAVLFMANRGRRLALAVGVVVALVAAALFATTGQIPLFAGGCVLALVVWAALRLMAEIVEVIAETLLPR
jgi:hypothetical protein